MDIQILNIFFGIAATCYPILAAYYFRGTNSLGKAVSYMFIGESVGMVITLTFGILSYLGYLDNDMMLYTHIMRSVMFLVAIITSLHLGIVVKSLIDKDKNVS